MRRACVLIFSALVVCLTTSAALARAPERSSFTFHPVNPDLFAEPGSTQHCAFPVVGEWNVVGQETDFFDHTSGDPTRTVLFFHIVGTLSNPRSDISVPDRGHDRFTLYYGPMGRW
jgi:hypothetical protein